MDNKNLVENTPLGVQAIGKFHIVHTKADGTIIKDYGEVKNKYISSSFIRDSEYDYFNVGIQLGDSSGNTASTFQKKLGSNILSLKNRDREYDNLVILEGEKSKHLSTDEISLLNTKFPNGYYLEQDLNRVFTVSVNGNYNLTEIMLLGVNSNDSTRSNYNSFYSLTYSKLKKSNGEEFTLTVSSGEKLLITYKIYTIIPAVFPIRSFTLNTIPDLSKPNDIVSKEYDVLSVAVNAVLTNGSNNFTDIFNYTDSYEKRYEFNTETNELLVSSNGYYPRDIEYTGVKLSTNNLSSNIPLDKLKLTLKLPSSSTAYYNNINKELFPQLSEPEYSEIFSSTIFSKNYIGVSSGSISLFSNVILADNTTNRFVKYVTSNLYYNIKLIHFIVEKGTNNLLEVPQGYWCIIPSLGDVALTDISTLNSQV